ncbi:SDR family NAD(P)-dependent oxidoreductase [Tahibacter amnicola]|uniref:SDR family NAD(P)-dependent oxidoreductase n=1 Tax=Tahibacter amnicola TaxID=2976241 RepID=A0ABY6BI62_9GAMM|nr:SDR family NAD(P)-dependent oxidoreductase [Tahibacter amnicola]UXI69474.1 SDR family NAD(P)-dependent oxidoreductase [Tahibacter amnicola]
MRGFELTLQPESLQVSDVSLLRQFDGATVFIARDEADAAVGDAIAEHLQGHGAQVIAGDHAALRSRPARSIQHLITVLPRRPADGVANHDSLAPVVERLSDIAVVSAEQGCASVSIVQSGALATLGRGDVGVTGIAQGCARAFAASLHLERPTAKIRVLDIEEAMAPVDVAIRVAAELAVDGGYVASFHDGESGRHIGRMAVVSAAAMPPRDIPWNGDDVVIVTGGGKGITAECALAFARQTRVRTVLVGSTTTDQALRSGSEIAATLERFRNAGLTARYYACDIADAGAVSELVRQVETEVGPVSGFVHGAGVNKPRRAEQVNAAQAMAEIAPKLLGALNFVAALDASPLKLIVGLGSIIGLTGMPGNAWYAFSNEALDLVLQQHRARHPSVDVVTVAYSVWAEVGMGAKLGSTDKLAKMGIDAIPKDQGVDYFLACALRRQPASQIVVASRLGGLDTWPIARDLAPLHRDRRFVEEVIAHEPGVELVCRTRLSIDSDLYLKDHYYRGVYLFPTVFGLEAMAQLAGAVLDRANLSAVSLENVSLERPIVVNGGAGERIELHALVLDRTDDAQPLKVRVGIRTEQTGFKRDHFAGTVVFAPPSHDAGIPSLASRSAEPVPMLDPMIDLYGGLLFQGAVFQRIEQVFEMGWGGSFTAVRRGAESTYFHADLPSRLHLGDPSFRDALLQTAQLSEKGQYLPVHIDTLHLHDLEQSNRGTMRVANTITGRRSDELLCDVHACTEDGQVIESLLGYRLKRTVANDSAPTPDDWVDPSERDARLLDDALSQHSGALKIAVPKFSLAFVPGLSQMEKGRRHLSELPLFLEAIHRVAPDLGDQLDALEIQWSASGKPSVVGFPADDLNVSLSHDLSHCLSVCGFGAQGCDIESVDQRSAEQWRALLGDKREGILAALNHRGDTLDDAGTRIWCAVESAQKALGKAAVDLEILRSAGDAILWRASAAGEAEGVEVLTFPVVLTRPRRKMVGIVVKPATVTPPPGNAALPAVLAALDRGADDVGVTAFITQGPQGQTQTCHRFRVPFKEVTSRRRRLNFPVFADWMGMIRELAITGIAVDLVPDFASGRWGMVTNHSNISIVGDANCLDLIEGRLWISRVYGAANSSIDMHFDWVRIDDSGAEHPVASANMATTWVEITGHGTVELKPLPDYLSRFAHGYLPKEPFGDPLKRNGAPTHGLALKGALYRAPAAPKIEPELARHVFATSMEESNLVGNIYFSNYYHWQGRLLDRFLFGLSSDYFRAGVATSDLHCIDTRIEHLREAMPFDDIEVVMGLEGLFENGVRLHFDFYRVGAGGDRAKLAFGVSDFAWVVDADNAAGALTAPLPDWLKSALLQRAGRLASLAAG